MAEACKARLLREHAVRLERHMLVIAGKLGMVEQKRLERDERAHRTLKAPCQFVALALSGLCVAADAREPAHSRQMLQECLVRLQQRLSVAEEVAELDLIAHVPLSHRSEVCIDHRAQVTDKRFLGRVQLLDDGDDGHRRN